MMVPGRKLRNYRLIRRVGQQELAEELGRTHASYVCRLERRDIGAVEYAEAIAAIERVGARNDAQAAELLTEATS